MPDGIEAVEEPEIVDEAKKRSNILDTLGVEDLEGAAVLRELCAENQWHCTSAIVANTQYCKDTAMLMGYAILATWPITTIDPHLLLNRIPKLCRLHDVRPSSLCIIAPPAMLEALLSVQRRKVSLKKTALTVEDPRCGDLVSTRTDEFYPVPEGGPAPWNAAMKACGL